MMIFCTQVRFLRGCASLPRQMCECVCMCMCVCVRGKNENTHEALPFQCFAQLVLSCQSVDAWYVFCRVFYVCACSCVCVCVCV